MVVSQAQDQPKRLTLRNDSLSRMLHLHQFTELASSVDLNFIFLMNYINIIKRD